GKLVTGVQTCALPILKVNATAARPKLHPGDDDPSLTAHAGLALVGELVARIGLVEGIDARLGHLKARRRGLSPGQFVVSMAESRSEERRVGNGGRSWR